MILPRQGHLRISHPYGPTIFHLKNNNNKEFNHPKDFEHLNHKLVDLSTQGQSLALALGLGLRPPFAPKILKGPNVFIT